MRSSASLSLNCPSISCMSQPHLPNSYIVLCSLIRLRLPFTCSDTTLLDERSNVREDTKTGATKHLLPLNCAIPHCTVPPLISYRLSLSLTWLKILFTHDSHTYHTSEIWGGYISTKSTSTKSLMDPFTLFSDLLSLASLNRQRNAILVGH